MQVCEKCGAEVKFIAGGFQKTYTCSPVRISAVTDSGRLFGGYMLHVCGGGGSGFEGVGENGKEKDGRR